MKKECQLILLFSRTHPSVHDLEEASSLLKGGLNWDLLINLSNSNGTTPLIYRNLMRLNLDDEIMNMFKNAYNVCLRNNIINSEGMHRAVALLGEAGIPAISLKGAKASEEIFGDLGLYPSSDIDLLVRPADFERARDVLVRNGWERCEGIIERAYRESHYHVPYSGNLGLLELHWNLAFKYFRIPPDFWWEGAVDVEQSGLRYKILSPERYILYAIFRLYAHGFRPLKFLVFLSEIVRYYNERVDWQMLLHYASRFGMLNLVIFSLRLSHDLLGCQMVETILEQEVSFYDFYQGKIAKYLFEEEGFPLYRIGLFAMLLDRRRDACRVLLRRFFPSLGEISLRYGVPLDSRRIYPYYLFNPVLIFFRRL